MAQVLNLSGICTSTLQFCRHNSSPAQKFATLQLQLNCNGRFSCLFSDNRKQEQARKALEGALGGKKDEFARWNKEIEKREKVGGGGNAGGGGWSGWGGRFGWSNDDHFWQEAQQTGLTVLGIIFLYLLIAKGEVILATVFNPLLFALRSTRNSLSYVTSQVRRKVYPDSTAEFEDKPKAQVFKPASAKQKVLKKWGTD
ncbi:hypothetical protein Ancab_033398 [Ancistrocladus abbreviatus]